MIKKLKDFKLEEIYNFEKPKFNFYYLKASFKSLKFFFKTICNYRSWDFLYDLKLIREMLRFKKIEWINITYMDVTDELKKIDELLKLIDEVIEDDEDQEKINLFFKKYAEYIRYFWN